MRAFGAAVFIQHFLAGGGPQYGVEAIDPGRGAPQADIHAAYRGALHRAWAENMVAIQQERRIREEKASFTIGEADQLLAYYMARTPYKLSRMRSHSFRVYFSLFKKLGWVEPSPDGEEPSTIQDYYPPAPPRRYYRLTPQGQGATSDQLRDPLQAVYNYPRSVRSARKPLPRLPAFAQVPVPVPAAPVEEVRPPPPPRVIYPIPPPRPTPPPPPEIPEEEPEEVPEAVQERWDTLVDGLKRWTTIRPADAERILRRFAEKEGVAPMDDALDRLQEYRDITRQDYETAEEYRDARGDAWQEFLDALDEVELEVAA